MGHGRHAANVAGESPTAAQEWAEHMVWNSGGGPGNGPWGNPGGPWGNGGGRPNGRPGGPWGGGGGPGGIPDLDQFIARMQAKARRFVPGGPGGVRGGGRGLALLGLAALLVWLGSGFYRVQPDQQGVVLRFGAYNRTTLPGLNYHIPWPVERALTPAVTRIERAEIGFRGAAEPSDAALYRGPVGRDPLRGLPGRGAAGGDASRDVAEESLMLTGDENIIDINFSVFWRIRDAGDFLFNTRNPGNTVKSAAESVMREVIGRTPIQPALTEARARIEQSVMSGTQYILDQYKAGVEITQVQLQKVDPPNAVIDSFRDVQRANTDAERMRNEAESYRNDIVPRARGEAARLTAEAEGARLSLVAEANGQAQRFLSVYQAYQAAKDVTLRRLYIETMQEILTKTPSVVVDDRLQGIVPFLPLDPQGRPGGAAPGSPPQQPPQPQQPRQQGASR